MTGQWQLQTTWSLLPNGANQFFVDQSTPKDGFGSIIPWTNPSIIVAPSPQFQPKAGDTVHLQGILQDSTGLIDSGGDTPVVWDPTSGVPLQQLMMPQGLATLNPIQSSQLANADQAATQSQQLLPNFLQNPVLGVNDFLASIHDAVIMNLGTLINPIPISIANWLLPKPMDFLAPRHLAGPNECFPVNVDISGEAYYSLGVTIDTYPADWVFATPGAEWSFHDLAVLTIMRGGSISRRYGIHTLSFSVSPIPDSITQTVTDLPISIQPGDFHVQVDWAAGVCGSLIGYVLP